MKPKFQRLWSSFPDHTQYPRMKDLYTALGGTAEANINAPGFGPDGNTCASRLSVAFNKSGAPINKAKAAAVRARTIGTASGSRIIFRVADLRRYLRHILGKPVVDSASPYDDAFRGKSGIIAFSVNWDNATGHIALWDGQRYREPGYDNYSRYVNPADPRVRTSGAEFWELA